MSVTCLVLGFGVPLLMRLVLLTIPQVLTLIDSLTHSLIDSLTHSLTHLLTYLHADNSGSILTLSTNDGRDDNVKMCNGIGKCNFDTAVCDCPHGWTYDATLGPCARIVVNNTRWAGTHSLAHSLAYSLTHSLCRSC
jgi:hypothetical protein